MISNYLKLLRIHQWTKNLFLFLPLFFGGEFLNLDKQANVLIAFISFSFMASAVYCFNDIADINYDKLHPRKKFRPLASGQISKRNAYFLMFVFIVTSLTIPVLAMPEKMINFIIVLIVYLIMNLLYSRRLKFIPIVDVFILSLGFVLRIVAGGVAGEVIISHWIIIMTFLLALFLSFAKRLDDLVIFENKGIEPRKNISSYNQTFLNQTITIIATITMVSYIMYTVSAEVIDRFQTDHIYVTAIFVLAGILRYLQLTMVESKSGNPSEVLLKERFIQLCLLGWISTFIYIVYL